MLSLNHDLANDAYDAFIEKLNSEPASLRPVDAYKAIIDLLVTETTHSLHARLVEDGLSSEAPSYGDEITRALTPEQKKLFAAYLRSERVGAIHDVLAALEGWIICHEVDFTFRGEPMSVEICEGLNGDFIGRLTDWEWPTARRT